MKHRWIFLPSITLALGSLACSSPALAAEETGRAALESPRAGPAAHVQRQKLLAAGMRLYKAGQYADALKLFEQAEILSHRISSNKKGTKEEATLLAQIAMIKGISLMKLGRPTDAEKEFKAVLALEPVEPELMENARHLLNQTVADGSTAAPSRPWWAFGEFSAGYNSNVFGDGASESKIAGATAQALAGVGYRFFQSGAVRARIGYSFSWDEVLGVPLARIHRHAIRGGVSRRSGAWEVAVEPSAQFEFLDSGPFVTRAGLRFRTEWRRRRHELGFSYDLTGVLPGNSQYEYLRGMNHAARVNWTVLRASWSLTTSVSALNEAASPLVLSTGELPIGNRSIGPEILLSWAPAPRWQLEAGLGYWIKVFERRDDRMTTSSLRLTRKLHSGVSVHVTSGLTLNDSTLGAGSVDDKVFRQWVSSAGMLFDL